MNHRRKTPWLLGAAVLALTLAGAEPAEASKGCWCWVGIERGEKLIDYGEVGRYQDTESNKKRKCSTACAARCAMDLHDPERLCSKAGRPVPAAAKVGCFSVVGAKDNPNNTWDYDGHPSGFRGCQRTCSCSRGWYDANRDSCVTGACESVPGMPNGSKGGGYFAWNETLFVDISGKTGCKVVPTGGAAPCKWTPWLNRDNESGAGDFETLADFVRTGEACASPLKIECQTADGRPVSSTGQPYVCDPKRGGICENDKLPAGQRCRNYRVRFCC